MDDALQCGANRSQASPPPPADTHGEGREKYQKFTSYYLSIMKDLAGPELQLSHHV